MRISARTAALGVGGGDGNLFVFPKYVVSDIWAAKTDVVDLNSGVAYIRTNGQGIFRNTAVGVLNLGSDYLEYTSGTWGYGMGLVSVLKKNTSYKFSFVTDVALGRYTISLYKKQSGGYLFDSSATILTNTLENETSFNSGGCDLMLVALCVFDTNKHKILNIRMEKSNE